MILLRSSKRNIFLFLAGFLLCGILHVALYGVDFTISFTEILCGSLTALWSITVQRRVTDRRECKLLLGIAAAHFMRGSFINDLGFLSLGLRAAALLLPLSFALWLPGRIGARKVSAGMIVGTAAMLAAGLLRLPADPMYYGLAASALVLAIPQKTSKK